MNFVSASIYQKAKGLALQEGLDPELLAAHQQHPALQTAADYLPFTLLLQLYEAADAHLAPGFAVRQGRQLQSEDYGTLGLAWRTCWQAKDVLSRVARFMVLVTDQGSAQLQENGGNTLLSLNRPTPRRGLEMTNETAMVMLVNVMREVSQQPINPTQVQFKHSSAAASVFEEFFQAPVQFQASANCLKFNSKAIAVPTVKADLQLQNYLVERLQEEEENIETQADHLLKNIKGLIQESLPSGIPSLIQVADHVKLSPRTLKRRLAEKSVSFRELVQQIQAETAIELLKHSQKSMGEITFLTGFSEASAFNRAFKRWTGKSPSNYRSSNK